MKEFVLYIVCLWCLAFLMSGCEDSIHLSERPDNNKPQADKVQIEIFARANSYHYPTVRTMDDEDRVGKTPWILVFNGENANATFVEAVQAFEMVGKRYVILTKQSGNSKYQLLILANPLNDKFYYGNNVTEYLFTESDLRMNMIPGITTLSEVCAKILTEPLESPATSVIPFSNDGKTIPMSYLLGVDKIDTTTRIENSDGSTIELIRVAAKVVVANKADNFYLKGITAVVNVPRQGRLHNQDGTVMNNMANLTEYCQTGYGSSLVVTDNSAVGQSTEMKPLYLYESDIQNNTYLIVEGTYENKDYFYKLVLVDGKYNLMDILRNHSYTFTIIKAKGPGYDTVEDAKASKASNVDLDYKLSVDDSYSYEAYRALLIINHNFKSFLNPNYLGKPGNLSYLSYQIKMYYAYGGNQDIISYLVDIDSYHDKLLEVELQGKQQFVLRSFSIPFSGIPDDLKKLCECPDFYSETTSENILKK